MHQCRLLTAVDAQQIHQGMGFSEGVDRPARHQPLVHGEALGFQQGGVAVMGSDGLHLIAGGAQILEQGQTKVVEIPAGVSHQQHLG